MLWTVAIILIMIAIIILVFLSWLVKPSIPNQVDDYPTIHARCQKDKSCDGATCVTQCGGDLTCDKIFHRCKKKLGGSCSSNIDCETGLVCHTWKCVSDTNSPDNESDPKILSNEPVSDLTFHVEKKQVRWSEKDEIFLIPPKAPRNKK